MLCCALQVLHEEARIYRFRNFLSAGELSRWQPHLSRNRRALYVWYTQPVAAV